MGNDHRELESITEQLIVEAKKLMQQGQFQQANSKVIEILEREAHEEAQYIHCVCLRYLKQETEALSAIEQLIELNPGYGRAYQEMGHCYRSMSKNSEAYGAYQKAVEFNPTLLASWNAIEQLATSTEQKKSAQTSIRHFSAMPRELISVNSMLHEGKLYKAEKLCRSYLQHFPRDPEAMRLLATLGVKQYILDDAEFVLESCLEFNPDYQTARIDYIHVLNKRQKFKKAFEQAEKLLASDDNNPVFQSVYADQCVALNKLDHAIEHYQKALNQLPHSEGIYLMLGHAYKTLGETDKAIHAYQQAYRIKPDFGDAYWSLANLKTYHFDEQQIDNMIEQIQSKAIRRVDQYHLCFALGKAFEDKKNFKKSFEYYQRGNDLKQEETAYNPDKKDAEFATQKQIFTRSFIEKNKDKGFPAKDPIFIVGLPRSGSTLIEQILASHSQIDGTLELANILATVYQLNGRLKRDESPKYPAIMNELSSDKFSELGKQYIDETKIHRLDAPFFIDKMPNNFQHIGLIKLILPNAKIIDARRNPMDCCFSGFKQLFAEGQEFSYGQESIARYYKGYVDLMNHWHNVFPGEILTVQYEDVVHNLESQVNRILDYLNLEFESACTEFHKTQRSVRTASAEQVRQPIYRSSVEQWKNFEPYLTTMKTILLN
ncbi:tetratricopeptide repeat-containing sulfotransferase family protein [Pleionea sediminis]|uniref:tetratricopeptide repeat-containing sulfotransferase family protein n=1 Tax=Pleionea sediminis TaxID=2569479 RepID=UPI001186C142|nr:tetratricopeptide repeat-containing sulfotransferase family protein [Pleionea sediminis]